MHLYDTAARAVVPLEPAGDPVSMYVCGITPYDAAHLGHAFTYHVFDVLARRLVARGLTVRHIRNITDVDDDILRVSRERRIDHRILIAEQVLRFEREMASIDILPVAAAPRASDHVPRMVEWVRALERNGFAYEVEGWVYFDTARFDRYGSLCGLPREQMIAASRERGADPDDVRKRDALDFVLWQPSLPDEPRWHSPWGDGRPGWHIECSVLATDFLGGTVDVHGGGEDLIYPHHESEVAQAECNHVRPFVRHWVHVAMVQLDGIKMSKSLGNLVFTRDLVRESSPAATRLLLASHHHRASWSYTRDELMDARERAARWRAVADSSVIVPAGEAAAVERAFFERLDDDLDTPGAIAVLEGLVQDAVAQGASTAASPDGVSAGLLLTRLCHVLGADLGTVPVRSAAAL